jgi:choline dehydrogenase-like flavoprotein
MGTARMGRDSKTSVLNRWNEAWDEPNVFVTDGACMTSSACQTLHSRTWRSRPGPRITP